MSSKDVVVKSISMYSDSAIVTVNDENSIIVPSGVPSEIITRIVAHQWDDEIHATSSDSRVGRIGEYAVKQSRPVFSDQNEAVRALQYHARVVNLHTTFLPEYTPFSKAFAAKDQTGWHTYIVQDWLKGKTVKSMPVEQRRDPRLVEAYDRLYKRVYTIYRAERDINRYIPQDERFELTKIQPIGKRADERRLSPVNMVESENLMVDPDTAQFYVFDYGRWWLWKPEMQLSYDRLQASITKKFERHIADSK